jgi:UPF0271 protein
MGESIEGKPYDLQRDLQLLSHVSSVNIACGFHAGDAHTMHSLVEAALEKGVAVGAHPSYPDRETFGRKPMSFTPSQVYDMTLYQVGALHAMVHVYGSRLHHVKPHGALYNMAAKDRTIADAISLALLEFDREIILYGLSGSELIKSAAEHGIKTCSEVFADRSYQQDGSLTPRDSKGAVITDLNESIKQVLLMIKEAKVKPIDGEWLSIVAETVCIHGDHEHAVSTALAVSDSLKKADVLIQQP